MAKMANRPQTQKPRTGRRKPNGTFRNDEPFGPRRPQNEMYNRSAYRSAAQRGVWED